MNKITFYFLWILVFTIPWQGFVVFPMFGTISRLVGFSAIVFACLYVLLNKRIGEPSLLLITMVLFIAWSLLTYFWSINPASTMGRTITQVQLLAMAWMIWELCKTQETKLSIIQAFILGTYIPMYDMIITYVQLITPGSRVTATGWDENYLAATLAIGIPLSIYLLIYQRNKILYWLNLFYLPLALFCIILTASRGGMLVALFSLMVFPLIFFSINHELRIKLVSFIILLAIMTLLWLPGNYDKIAMNVDRIAETPERIRTGDLALRQHIWKAGWEVFKDNPIVGVGSAGFSHAMVEYFYERRGAHNSYLSVLVDSGIIGIILFLSMFVIAILPNFDLPPPDKWIYIILLISLIIALIPITWETNKTTWFLLSILTLENSYVVRRGKINIISR
jgi:O-antigen ligase